MDYTNYMKCVSDLLETILAKHFLKRYLKFLLRFEMTIYKFQRISLCHYCRQTFMKNGMSDDRKSAKTKG